MWAVLLAGFASPALAAGNSPTAGDYSITIAGSYKGSGTATVTDDRLNISLSVTDEQSHKGELVVSDLEIKDNHFSGQGTVLGKTMTLQGRVDPPDTQDNTPRTARLVGTFTVKDGTHGRIAGGHGNKVGHPTHKTSGAATGPLHSTSAAREP